MSHGRDRLRVELEVGVADGGSDVSELRRPSATERDAPFRIALLGDFSGRGGGDPGGQRGRALGARRPVRVDRDSVDEAISRIQPSVSLDLPELGSSFGIRFASLEDFHPDQLYERMPFFRALADAGAVIPKPVAPPQPVQSQSTPPPSGILDSILGDSPLPPGGAGLAKAPSLPPVRLAAEPDDSLAEFVRRAVTPHVTSEPTASERELEARIGAAVEAAMRVVLHHPDFQALESLWRSVDFLTRRLETGERLQLHLLDVSREEFYADLAATDFRRTDLYRAIVERSVETPGAARWTLLVGCFSFGDRGEDFRALERLAAIAQASGAPLVAGADSALAGGEQFRPGSDSADPRTDVSPDWERVRRAPQARYLGLVLPRLLLRLPYGEQTDPCESLRFEEFAPEAVPEHESYLWGNGAIACALLLAETLGEGGRARAERVISGLPLHVYRRNGDLIATPPSEVLLSEGRAEQLLEHGLMPLLSMAESDSVILPRFQSVAAPAAPLAGHW
jgi:type VI secretion system protein ImpC